MLILVTRPEPDASRTAAEIEAAGHRAITCPLMSVDVTRPDPIDLDEVAALIATSRNGLEALVASGQLERARRLPIFAVGPATGARATALGFKEVISGDADARALLPLIERRMDPRSGLLLHLAGERIAFDLRGALEDLDFEVRQPVTYWTSEIPNLPEAVVNALASGAIDGVLLMSPATAEVFAALIGKAGLAQACSRVTFFCLSDPTARKIEHLGPRGIEIPKRPNAEEMLALIGAAHHEPG